ncbi:hypothetical protein Tco_0653316 [Tanacetum coccineum]|uniref:Uncharacterized protein n=1 Tax=Tanacetum coccineum TaxID=301880 RepID=A0ABQ4X015_9ASTR
MAAVNDVPQLVDKKGDDMMESVISCVSAKETWTDLVHSFEGPSDTKENKIMDLKLEYQTFRAKSTESFLQTYTRYKTLLNELANDGVNPSKHEINDFQENSDDEVDERTSEEYLRDLDIEYHERALLENSKRFSYEKQFLSQKANERILNVKQCGQKKVILQETSSSNSNNQADLKFQKDYKAEYKKMKAKLALLEANPSKVSDEEEVTQVKVLMALADDELTVGKSYAGNGE